MSTFKATYKTVGDFETFEETAQNQINLSLLVTQKSSLEMFSRIIKRTPVDTGGTRGNWQFASGRKPKGVVNKSGQEAMSEMVQGVQEWMPDKHTAYFANNVPWILKLENGGYGKGPKTTGGYSKQAPNGMVKVSVSERESIMMSNM